MTDPLGENSKNSAKKQEKCVLKPNEKKIISITSKYWIRDIKFVMKVN